MTAMRAIRDKVATLQEMKRRVMRAHIEVSIDCSAASTKYHSLVLNFQQVSLERQLEHERARRQQQEEKSAEKYLLQGDAT